MQFYRRGIWAAWSEVTFRVRMFVFHLMLIPSRTIYIKIFSLHRSVDSAPIHIQNSNHSMVISWGKGKLLIRTNKTLFIKLTIWCKHKRFVYMWLKAVLIGHQMWLELTHEGWLAYLRNHYTIRGAQNWPYVTSVCKLLSSSCRAASTDITDPPSPLLPIIHRFWQAFKLTSRILT